MAAFDEVKHRLGFGFMRLPQKDGAVDYETLNPMVDRFLEAGCTYFDTAWAYEGAEEAMKHALVERHPRETYQIATKNAAWLKTPDRAGAEAQFETSLERSGAGYFDYYLLHNLGENRTQVFEDYDLWNFILRKKEEGLIRHIGFSFHDTADKLDEILKRHPEAEFVQLQLNYIDWEDRLVQAHRNYETAQAHGKPVIVMEPVKGGLLANPPEPARRVFSAAEPEASFASWAVRFCADLPGVKMILSGMNAMEQLEDNLRTMDGFAGLSDAQRSAIGTACDEIRKIPLIPCTTCDYCAKVCPNSINISGSFEALNRLTLYNNFEVAKGHYDWKISNRGLRPASECIRCGACEAACPQHLPIPELLVGAKEKFDV